MTLLKKISTFTFGVFLILGGIMHFIKPEMYNPFIPDFLPKILVNYLAGFVEIAVGAGVFIPLYRPMATLGILILMIAFLPLHIVDLFKDHPAIGSHKLAVIRLPLQFVLILWAWFISKK